MRWWVIGGGLGLVLLGWSWGALSQAPVKLLVDELRLRESGGGHHFLQQLEQGGPVTSRELTTAALNDGDSLVKLDAQQTLTKKRIRQRKRGLQPEDCVLTLPNPTQVDVVTVYLKAPAPDCATMTIKPPGGSDPDELEGYTLILHSVKEYKLKWAGEKWGRNTQGLDWPTMLPGDPTGYLYYKLAWNADAKKYFLLGQIKLVDPRLAPHGK